MVPTEELQRTLELQTLGQMMLQDGQVNAREYGLCQKYAARIGYSKAILDDMVNQLAGGKPSMNPAPPTHAITVVLPAASTPRPLKAQSIHGPLVANVFKAL